jgi:hypothetical protein
MKNMYGSSHFNIYSSLIIYNQSINVDIIILKLFIVLLFNNIYIVFTLLKTQRRNRCRRQYQPC